MIYFGKFLIVMLLTAFQLNAQSDLKLAQLTSDNYLQNNEVKQTSNYYLSIKASKPIALYQKADKNSNIIMYLPPNSVAIEHIGCKDLRKIKNVFAKRNKKYSGWCQIIYRGVYGWTQRQYLQKYVIEKSNLSICQEKTDDIDNFICSDYELLSLAKQLAEIYNHAEQKAKLSMKNKKNKLQNLQNSQSKWLTERNKCNSKDYYTKQICLIAAYKIRITYLQAKWMVVGNAPSYNYLCDNKKFIITKFLTDLLPSVMIQNNRKRLVMIDYSADIERKYFGDDGVYYSENNNETELKWLSNQKPLSCKWIK